MNIRSSEAQELVHLPEALGYELPKTGTSLLGYVVRRMHKTGLLTSVPGLIATGNHRAALRQIAHYCVAASTSFGRAHYQPTFNVIGEEASEPDPATGAQVSARVTADRPHLRISFAVAMPDGSRFAGSEEITGTRVGLHGLGMPAPSKMTYQSGDYSAELSGIITSELVLSLLGRTRIRAHGSLELRDSVGQTGRVSVERAGQARIEIHGISQADG